MGLSSAGVSFCYCVCTLICTHAVCHKACVPYDMRAVSYHTLGVTYTCSTLLETKAAVCQTKPIMTVFVLPIKYTHIRDVVTWKACRVMTRVSVSSPFYPKPFGGSHKVKTAVIVTLTLSCICCHHHNGGFLLQKRYISLVKSCSFDKTRLSPTAVHSC